MAEIGLRARQVRALHRRGGRVPWWLSPTAVAVALSAFVAYGIWTSLLGGRAESGPYLSPFSSPRWGSLGGVPLALLVLPVPLLLRASCYHYRKAYFRAFFRHPAACAHPEARPREAAAVPPPAGAAIAHARGYTGEGRLPLSLNNLHRFALYLVVPLLAVLWYDALDSLRYDGRLHAGLGSVLMLVNVVLLTGYTFGCHSLRHLSGGCLDCFSRARFGTARHAAWRCVSALTARHGAWAWWSLGSVLAVDLYIRALQHGMVDLHLGG